MDNFDFLMVSAVTITEELIAKVAARVDVSVERVRAYLGNDADQDKELLKAFLFFGVGPFNKR
jgi:hypothetical protein